MELIRFHRKDGIFIAVCLLIIIGGLWLSLKFFYKVFPEATIDFRLNRGQSEQVAAQFLHDQNLIPPTDYRHASRFGYDGSAKTYLEKELGVEKARAFLGHPVRLWYWEHRWFRPSTKEEFSVFISPEGEIVRLDHQVEEQAAGADLAEDSARAIAEQFLFGTMKQERSKLTFIESERVGRPHRADWTFTYRISGIEPVKGSDYRYEVGLVGDRISVYREFLHVPEAWFAAFSRLRSFNNIANNFAGVGFLLTAIAMATVLFLRLRKRDVKWRTAVIFGSVAAGLLLLNQLNELPLTFFWYDTTSSWSGFLVQTFFFGLLEAVGMGVIIMLLTAAAESIYRERYPDKLALPVMFTPRALGTKTAFRSILLGITLTAFFFAYQIVFYLVAGHYGAWSPSDVPYDNLLNTAMPWLAVLFMGFFPAVSEEFMSRMFSIPFLQKAFKSKFTWLALIIPAFIWGFGHAAYPNEPFWIRGAEVGIAGIIVGIIMLRFGILTTLVWHYTVDALYTALLLFRSHNPYFVVTAAVATGLLVIPLLLALFAYVRRGGFTPETGTLNADFQAAPEKIEEARIVTTPIPDTEPGVAYVPWPRRRRVWAALLLVAGIAATFIPVNKVGDFISYPISKEAAKQAFTDTLRAVGWANPDTLNITVFAEAGDQTRNDVPLIYLLKHAGSVEAFNRIADERLADTRWYTYAWNPENRLRFMGSVNSKTGRVEGLRAWLPEEMAGDSLSEDSARALVERALTAKGEDLSKLDLKEHSLTSRPKRLDYWFAYEARDGDSRNVAEAKYRRGGSVDGHYLWAGSHPWYKIPEKWERDRDATTAFRAVRKVLRILLIVGLIAWGVVVLALRTRKGDVPWKKAFRFSIIPAAIVLVSALNVFYLSQQHYFTAIEQPWGVFRTAVIIEWIVSVLITGLMFALGFALLGALYPNANNELRRAERFASRRDALFAMLATSGILLLLHSIRAWLSTANPAWIPFDGWNIRGDLLAAPLPFDLMYQHALTESLTVAAGIGLVAYLWSNAVRKPLMRLLFLAAFVLMFSGGVEPGEWLFTLITGALRVAAAFIILRFFVQGRPTFFIVSIVTWVGVGLSLDAFGLGSSSLSAHALAFVLSILLVLAWWLLRKPKSQSATTQNVTL
jgi:membrane protease YdiL (CAAX protease family)